MALFARFAATIAAAGVAGCASRPGLPPGIDGYHCAQGENTPAGLVSAHATPDYRGGFRNFTMKWERRSAGDGSLDATAYWGQGREAIDPPGWMSVSGLVVERVPPKGTVFRLQLSSGEQREELLALPKDYWKFEGPHRFGTSVLVRDQAFIEKFTHAAWMDITLVDPSGAIHAQQRLDLTGVPEAVTRMRQLGAQVLDELVDYQNRCTAEPHVDISEIVLRMRPAEDPATPGSTRTST